MRGDAHLRQGPHQDVVLLRGSVMHVMMLMLCWFGLGMSMVYVNKFMLTDGDFRYPFITVLCTNLFLWLWALVLTAAGVLKLPYCSRDIFLRQALPAGICMGLDIGLANWSLQYLNVTFFTIVRGAIPSFVLVFGLVCGLDDVDPVKIFSILAVCVGISLASMGEVQFHVPGVIMCVMSCVISGARWVLVQIVMSRDERLLEVQRAATTPLGAILLITPITVMTCVPFAIAFEVRSFLESPWAHEPARRKMAFEYILVAAIIAFFLQLSKYHLVKATSSPSMSLMGIFKQLLTIGGAVMIFGDRISIIKAAGFVICSGGLLSYAFVKQTRRDRAPARRASMDSFQDVRLEDLKALAGLELGSVLGYGKCAHARRGQDGDSATSETALIGGGTVEDDGEDDTDDDPSATPVMGSAGTSHGDNSPRRSNVAAASGVRPHAQSCVALGKAGSAGEHHRE